jgi:hypothetical protein
MTLLFRALLGVLALGLACALPAPAQTPQHVATVKVVSGDAAVVAAATGTRTPAAVGTRVAVGDRLVTGADGAIGITFADNTTLSLGPSSDMVVERFAYDPPANDYGFAARIARGTALFVSGQIAKYAPQSVAVTTPTGSIGIRGTRFLVKVAP